ncbi:MAG: hypothetical protein KAK00_05275 [Nanoarchaeota archaeon]|nr:hypothetical protein [Nanoarchaeota archaeon]
MRNIKQIGVVCFGNIARSQILGIYLRKYLSDKGSRIRVYSLGTATL